MKKLAYWVQLLILLLWIPCVMMLFRFIDEKRVAALFAGAGFLILPTLFLVHEALLRRSGKAFSKLHSFICLEFLIFSSLPIFLLRVLNWDADFSQLSIFGVSASFLHRFSNTNYMLLLLSAAFLTFKAWRNEKSQPMG